MMRTLRRLWWFVAAVTLASFAASCAGNGSITEGEKFGVAVGMPVERASAILMQRGLHRAPPIPNLTAPMCGGRAQEPGEELEGFSRGLNQDVVCLFVASGSVVAIAWEHPAM